MVNKKESVQYTIKWIMPAKGKVAFKELEPTYTLSEKVIKADPEKWGVKVGVRVDVNITGTEVTYLRKSENQDVPKEEVKETPVSETKQEPTLEPEDEKTNAVVLADQKTHILTVSGITATKEVISFKEETGTKWYQVPEELRNQFDTLGIKARATVKVTFSTYEVKGVAKPSVETIEVVPNSEDIKRIEESISTEPKTSEPVSSSDKSFEQYKVKNSTGTSIEHQVALKGAVDIVVALINQGEVHLKDSGTLVSGLTAQFIKDIAG